MMTRTNNNLLSGTKRPSVIKPNRNSKSLVKEQTRRAYNDEH